jgi:NAD(P)-dependent dehydrogenase (short-subunit alcohol dehydrogenase family)
MKGKIILITGATAGIGKAAALALAKQGARVVIHGRNEAKLAAVQQEIILACGHYQVDVLVGDLLLLSDVRKMADTFNSRYERLDVVINNAGSMMGSKRQETPEGHEKTIAINLLSPFLLTGLLLDKLMQGPGARIINVASSAHKQNAKPDFDDLESKQGGYAPLRIYGNAKLFLILASQQLNRRLKAKGIQHITVNSLHPGAVSTSFLENSHLDGFWRVLMLLSRRFFKTPEQGADTMVYLASSPAVEGVSGQYFVNRKPAAVNRRYNSLENEKKVWDYCVAQTGWDL